MANQFDPRGALIGIAIFVVAMLIGAALLAPAHFGVVVLRLPPVHGSNR